MVFAPLIAVSRAEAKSVRMADRYSSQPVTDTAQVENTLEKDELSVGI